MERKIYKPTRWDPEEDWPEYIATRIEWAIDLSRYGISKQVSVRMSKNFKQDLLINLEGLFESDSLKKLDLTAVLYDVNGHIKDARSLIEDVVNGKDKFSCPLIAKCLYKFDKIVICGSVHDTVDSSDMLKYLENHVEYRNLPKFKLNPISRVAYNKDSYFYDEGPDILDEIRIEFTFFCYIVDPDIDVTLYDIDGNIKDSKKLEGILSLEYHHDPCVLKAKDIFRLKKIVVSGKIQSVYEL